MKLALHWQILIGMVLGVLFGLSMTFFPWGKSFVNNWIAPFGSIFISLLKLIAIPLILASLIKGIADLKDISKFSKIGGKTIVTYIVTTLVAIIIGLTLVNIVKPGQNIAQSTIDTLVENYANDPSLQSKIATAGKTTSSGPLQFLVDIVPDNIFGAASDNGSMLQVIFFAILFGIGLLLIEPKKAKPVTDVIDGINDVILKIVDLIMLIAPFAVFALLAKVIVTTTDPNLLMSLLTYALTVVGGLLLMVGIYMLVISLYVKKSPIWFLKQISPAQLLAFSTSSSAATLPVTMERVTEHIGVDKEVSSFVLPVGATINMDGTSLYQAVAAVFICTALHHEITFVDQLTIVLTALLASIGSAAVPGAGMVMLVIVLESIGFPADKLAIGLALIFAVDRPLDMCRTVINVTGDATVATLIAHSEGKLGTPKVLNWDDNYKD
ncbi:MAG: Na+/H+-dicarboxylate symporter [Maribacter sp.]|jgi:Na+/H+-dicarboxylate symporter